MKCLEKISIQFITFEECVESTAHIMEGKKSKIFLFYKFFLVCKSFIYQISKTYVRSKSKRY